MATGRRSCLAADLGSSILSPLFVRFSEQEGKSKWRGKTTIDGTARREKRAFRFTERFDLSVVASRNLKQNVLCWHLLQVNQGVFIPSLRG